MHTSVNTDRGYKAFREVMQNSWPRCLHWTDNNSRMHNKPQLRFHIVRASCLPPKVGNQAKSTEQIAATDNCMRNPRSSWATTILTSLSCISPFCFLYSWFFSTAHLCVGREIADSGSLKDTTLTLSGPTDRAVWIARLTIGVTHRSRNARLDWTILTSIACSARCTSRYYLPSEL